MQFLEKLYENNTNFIPILWQGILALIICFIFRGILRAAKKLQENDEVSNKTHHKFYWLASDGWGKQSQVVRDIEDFAVGAITVELESKKIPSMYFLGI